jgi:hypothetical protein
MHGDKHAKPAALFIKNKAVVLHADINGEECVIATMKKDVLNLGKDIVVLI